MEINPIELELQLKAENFFKNWDINVWADGTLKRSRKYILNVKLNEGCTVFADVENFSQKRLNKLGYKNFFSNKRRTFVFDSKTNKFSELVPKSFKLLSRKNAPK